MERKIFIISEIGVNWNGSLTLAKEMIERSAEAGADAIKFQLFTKNEIVDSPYYEKLKKMVIPDLGTLTMLKTCAERNNLEFIASAMYPQAIDWLNKLGCNFIKIRERDSANYDLINKALKTGRTILISTTKRPLNLYYLYHPNIRWMYCLPYYPPRLDQFDLNLAATYHGISSHFPHYTCDLAAASVALAKYGAPYIIEKHVMLKPDERLMRELQGEPFIECIDFPVSITFNQLKELVSHVKRLEQLTIRE